MTYMEEYNKWINSNALADNELEYLKSIAGDPVAIENCFYAPLEFGTAGLRGTMGPGINRMNVHVVRHTTQGLAELIISEGPEACDRGVAICYDCRIGSEQFAQEAACVLVANGIRVRLFESLRPTPELSFAIRRYRCMSGINITASHNPREYNGFKVYWSDGAQLPPAHADVVAKTIAGIDIFTGIKTMPYQAALDSGRLTILGDETDEEYLDQVIAQSINRDAVASASDSFKVVYTPFHGTGHKLVPEILKRLGLKQIICVPEQMIVDGNFPTVKSPNPEDKEGFTRAIEIAREENCDLIIGTDPDADRVGIIVRDDAGEYVTISGNQTGVLLLDYIINARKQKGTMPEYPVAIKTIVTTEMARAVAAPHNVEVIDSFTGFKFMAEIIGRLEREGKRKFIMAYEESYGYLIGDQARDKDAVVASMLIAEMAAVYSLQGITLYGALQRLFAQYGNYLEETVNLVMPGIDGLMKMKSLMSDLRGAPPKEICGVPVLEVRDYLSGKSIKLSDMSASDMELKGSNVLSFELADRTRFIVRPSGTEPKIKVYVLTRGDSHEQSVRNVEKYKQFALSLKQE